VTRLATLKIHAKMRLRRCVSYRLATTKCLKRIGGRLTGMGRYRIFPSKARISSGCSTAPSLTGRMNGSASIRSAANALWPTAPGFERGTMAQRAWGSVGIANAMAQRAQGLAGIANAMAQCARGF
jgi:hypothetical protein